LRRSCPSAQRLNRELPRQLVDYEGPRGDALERVFIDHDAIREGKEGKSFNAFGRLLTDPAHLEALKGDLQSGRWEQRVFLEQERINWLIALAQ
jgi:hypothetical protein